MKRKINLKHWKNYVKNLSIRRKMVASLVFCVIIPIILLGILTTSRVLHLSEQNLYEIQMSQMAKSGKDIENMYELVAREAATLAGDKAIQDLAADRATVMDYKNAAKKMVDAAEKIDYCSTITLSKEGIVLFQRGPLYMNEEEDTAYTRQIEQEKATYLWRPEHPVTFKKGIITSVQNQISYYTTVMKELTLQNQGVLSIHINASEFLGQLVPNQEENRVFDIIIADSRGNTLVSREKNKGLARLCWETYMGSKGNGESGYFPIRADNGTFIVLFTKCGSSGLYLFQIERKLSFYNTQILFIIAAVLLCIIFGVVYGMIQNHTIIKPLQHLSIRIDTVKSGILEKKDYKVARDEIGHVESGFENMVAHINELINQVYMQTIKTQEAEREALLAKMNPHFLYNSLEAIHWLAIRNKDYEVSEQLEALGDVYRHILRNGEGIISIQDDMEFIDNYLFLLDFQMGDRVAFISDIPEEVYGYKIPKLITQPLIENAIQHGLKNVSEGGKVKIRIRKVSSGIDIIVIDNGVGCDAKRLNHILEKKDSKEAFALRNINERVHLRYGGGYGVKIFSKKGYGTFVRIRMGMEDAL
ncbi:MAG TPA: histidine kinase [Clostridiales bacterium]|nr:histidine kinase [Clostridiales bacterium]